MIIDPQTPPIMQDGPPQAPTLSIPPEVANAPWAQAGGRLSQAMPQWHQRASLPPAGRAPTPYQPQYQPPQQPLSSFGGYGGPPPWMQQQQPQWQPPPWAQQQLPPWMQGGGGGWQPTPFGGVYNPPPPQPPPWQSPWGGGQGQMNPWQQPQQRSPWQQQGPTQPAGGYRAPNGNTGIGGGLPPQQPQAPKPLAPAAPPPPQPQTQYGGTAGTPIINKQNETY